VWHFNKRLNQQKNAFRSSWRPYIHIIGKKQLCWRYYAELLPVSVLPLGQWSHCFHRPDHYETPSPWCADSARSPQSLLSCLLQNYNIQSLLILVLLKMTCWWFQKIQVPLTRIATTFVECLKKQSRWSVFDTVLIIKWKYKHTKTSRRCLVLLQGRHSWKYFRAVRLHRSFHRDSPPDVECPWLKCPWSWLKHRMYYCQLPSSFMCEEAALQILLSMPCKYNCLWLWILK